MPPLLTFVDKVDIKSRGKGRPRKDIDIGVMLHMLKNDAPITAVARHLGIHRDTLYLRYMRVIEEGRKAHKEAWREIFETVVWPPIQAHVEKRRLYLEELNAKYLRSVARAKRAYRRARCRYLFWRKYPD